MDFVKELKRVLDENSDKKAAEPMAAYMKNLFPYLGIRNEKRKGILKPIWNEHSAEIKSDYRNIALELWKLPEREFHYCAMEILYKEIKNRYEKEDIGLIEKLLTTHSWWDSVDFLAKHILGNYLLAFPDEIPKVVKRFSDSENMWLNRSVILFQLGYKSKTNEKLLFGECRKHASNKEFFIPKAIGWALREYAKTNPEAVVEFVSKNRLSPLSKREALKNL
ncbi:DNA alkylation repair protein [Flavobacterium sp. MAH-1]|uniref:DNA alkylation repair protein n=1 Tax=Flavobacterium agri TaxID=2743471 RepID=A0A7Y9C656_9FLAO|nr:DNA alkylation repair protein [Flavobacterium agri]NUY79862.1 DNA alkylation repair protein [Flavobacterium agri]NYA69887.1 DNA alkylation repair protein [Flavobacterium agri]